MHNMWVFLSALLLLSGVSARTLQEEAKVETIAGALAAENLTVLLQAIKVFPDLEAAVNNSAAAVTVFAPTNAALLGAVAALGVGSLTGLVEKFPVADILKYHIVPTPVKSTEIPFGKPIFPLLTGKRLIPDNYSGVTIRGRNSAAKVVKADITANKSVIHIIDNVLLPANPVAPAYANPAEAAEKAKLTSLLAAVKKANLTEALSDPKLVATIFAPTDEAFAKALEGLKLTLDTIPMELLANVLKYHVAPGYGPTWRMVSNGFAKTLLENQTLEWVYPDDKSKVPNVKAAGSETPVKIVEPDVFAGEAVIHVIDAVLLPKL